MPETNAHRELADYQVCWVNARLKQLRYLSGLSLTEVEGLVAMKASVIGRIESGQLSNSLVNIAILVSAYGVSLSDFYALCPTALPKARRTPPEDKLSVLLGSDSEEKRFTRYMRERYSHLSTAKWDAHILQVLRNSEAAKAKKKKP